VKARHLATFGPLIALFVACAFFASQSARFLTPDNFSLIAQQVMVVGVLAIGQTLIILTAGIDLSCGMLMALGSVLMTTMATRHGMSPVSAIVLGLGATTLAGIINGLLVTRIKLPPFIVTLGMMLVGSGLAFLLADGQSISAMPDAFVWLGRGADWVGLPNAVVLMFGLYGVAHVVMTHTRLGRHFYAVGGNREAAMLSGSPLNRVVLVTYVASALLAGLAGLIMASQLKSGSPTYGTMYELYVIAAVVVGGASLSGGKGRMFGTLIGALTIAVIRPTSVPPRVARNDRLFDFS
jgi:ribose/xylose/arabinose/galactoside ABC-type transport system permease subunit